MASGLHLKPRHGRAIVSRRIRFRTFTAPLESKAEEGVSIKMFGEINRQRRRFLGAGAAIAAGGLGIFGALTAGARALRSALADEGPMPDLGGAAAWLNSEPLTARSLRGKVVLVNFWTYSCINSLRELPYIASWAARYKDSGLVVIGAHTPEFGFEKERANVENAVRELQITFPVPIDSNHAIWQSFHNEYWPADYLVDANGRIRYHHFGEGDYGVSERVIQTLLQGERICRPE